MPEFSIPGMTLSPFGYFYVFNFFIFLNFKIYIMSEIQGKLEKIKTNALKNIPDKLFFFFKDLP